jgi:hypothetical protein
MQPELIEPGRLPGIPLTHFFTECLWYFVPMGVLHLIVFLLGSLILTLIPRNETGLLGRRIGHLGLFLILFLIVGSIFNGVWACFIYNHLYHSADYIFDFIPLLPVTMNADAPQVSAYGTTLAELNIIWFLFAAATWAVAIGLYQFILREMKAKRAASVTINSKGAPAGRS